MGVGKSTQVNELLRVFIAHNGELSQLDQLAKLMKWPSQSPYFANGFFEERWVKAPGAHIKAFASEMIQVIHILKMVLPIACQHLPTMAPHLDCFNLLVQVVELYGLGGYVVRHVDRLEVSTDQYLDAYHALSRGGASRRCMFSVLGT